VDSPQVDAAIVERAQRGDKAAFSLLVRKYQHKIAGLVSRFVHDRAEVEDVVQEVFIKAYRAIRGFRGESAFYTWLYRIAINTAKNYLVAHARRPPHTDIEADEVESTELGRPLRDITTPEGSLSTKQMSERISRAIAALPEELRTAIMLRELEGLSYEEIAGAMDCPVGTVRSRIFRAREAIDRELGPWLH
jgi:RNA polymerase sigma-70 factor (ECF subfamily)